MNTASTFRHSGSWPQSEKIDSITLDFDQRFRRRIALTTDSGESFLLNLDEAVPLRQGDGIALDDERGWIEVIAAPEPLVRVSAAGAHMFTRLAWHIGNRHIPAEITPEAIFIRPDPVIEHMLEGLGATVTHVDRPFQPEPGAYGNHGHQ